jgi:hypothetical protein
MVTVLGPVLVILGAAVAIFALIGRIAAQIPEFDP